jgi:hypothetical protein
MYAPYMAPSAMYVGLVGDRPRVLAVVPPERRAAGRGEELRHVFRVQVRADRLVLLGAQRVEDREDVLVLDEHTCLADGLGRDVPVVEVLVVDLALVHAAARVDVLEVGVRALGEPRRKALRDAGQGRRAADVDRRRRDPGSDVVPPKATGMPSTRSAAVAIKKEAATWSKTECIAELLAEKQRV